MLIDPSPADLVARPRTGAAHPADTFFRSAYAGKPAAETVAAMTLAIAMNPHFLLHQ